MKKFDEWLDSNKSNIWVEYCSNNHLWNEADDSKNLEKGVEELASAVKENPPIQNKKSWIKTIWNKYKNTISLAAISGLGIGAMLASGVPWTSLVSIFGAGALNHAMSKTFSNVIPTNDDEPKIVGMLKGHDKVFYRNGKEWIPTTHEDLAGMIKKQNGSHVIHRNDDSRYNNEVKLDDLLKKHGVDINYSGN